MSKLQRVVEILNENQQFFEDYFLNHVVRIYSINIIDFDNINESLNDALKLFYYSMTTRQRTPNNPIQNRDELEQHVRKALQHLNDINIEVLQRYYNTVRELNCINGAGQKIISMFLKFVVMHSENLINIEEVRRLLWLPLDVHLIKFLFTTYSENGLQKWPHRLKIFEHMVNKDELNLRFCEEGVVNNHLLEIQNLIKETFEDQNIDSPVIVLDNLWVIGATRCNFVRFSDKISCNNCMFNIEYKNQSLCEREGVW